ncbi:hypothetical protein ABFU82_24645 [Nocardioides sp. WV_118_6]
MSVSAYVDESEPSSGETYLLGCALVGADDADGVRTTLVRARRRGERKVHWHDRLPAERPPLARLVAGLPVKHLLVVRDDCRGERSERRRRKCLEHLLWILDSAHEVGSVTLEARQARQNAGDMDLLSVMRSARIVRSDLRLHHVAGPQEPLLWIPDVVAGAFSAGRSGERPAYAPLLGGVEVQHTPGSGA